MKDYNLIIGSHVSMNKQQNYLLGALTESLNNDANAMMIYTGPPQNTIRVSTDHFFISEFYQQLPVQHFSIDNVIIHAPYIINLANTTNPSTFEIAVEFLRKEIIRADEIGIKTIVLHPGSAVGAPEQVGLDRIVEGLNLVLTSEQKAKIALETMAGKGSELGTNFAQLKYIIDNVLLKDKVGVCWDTCHMHDAGYQFKENLEDIINEFDQLIGLDRLLCLHINDSKNPLNAHKDRHENIGYGYLGFETLLKIIYHPKLDGMIKILETPYVGEKGKDFAPYKTEIAMIKLKQFTDPFQENGKVKIDLGE
ncbi:MAG: deoxyribonuclease IV [Spiroplasma poulsonii]|uniref:Probable endonuclease 4 n=1 Tax=Spiroplasma poulsonii TaxID=2138 RepID=A0A2P6FD62_9MOLU|nr:deoxyribonuclease IV [Spiroplasma poulsonii]KAF0851029.1 putative endonuclease 4 [Spiroplasma poulsonii]MBW1241946.1 deoxyribonuclease IV [Spiroplasma poulsonii]PQM31400.1 putative endonuclease 4 [Spiroplasma poulsonii]PWF96414.1 putative endonuclease 4 [Spiroplasma poulsonii]PWF99191.1 putative endonuclease 4 [Spiroplasma poulsonii]